MAALLPRIVDHINLMSCTYRYLSDSELSKLEHKVGRELFCFTPRNPTGRYRLLLDDERDLGMLGRKLLYILDLFPPELTFHRDVVALYAEWPSRPAMVLTADGTPGTYLVKALDWGYAGIVLQAAKDFERAVADRCYLTARKDREPIGKYTFDGAALPIGEGRDAILNELAAQSVLGNNSVACDPVPAILSLIADEHPGKSAKA